MKHILAFMILIFAAVAFSGCGTPASPGASDIASGIPDAGSAGDTGEASAALSDWILGSDFGITSGAIDAAAKTVTLTMSEDRFGALSEADKRDIETAVRDILALYLPVEAAEYRVVYQAGAQTVIATDVPVSVQASPASGEAAPAVSGEIVNLIFIHHSCGENWLNDGLNVLLGDNGYHVADIYYGWREYGDHTDTIDWPMWFQDGVMSLVYQELGTMTASNRIDPAPGENTIVMFKSCYPNSDVGPSIDDEKTIYNSLLSYFAQHPDKMFILVTPPPMTDLPYPEKTRELCNWLVDRENGWLGGYETGNVFVFDFYNVLTDPGAHHYYQNGEEVHTVAGGADTLYYDSDGDNHPNGEGNAKAAQEFIGLLNYWYGEFSGLN